MKTMLVRITILSLAVTVFGGDMKPTDSDAPIMQCFAVTQIPLKPGEQNVSPHPRFAVKVEKEPLLTITSIHNLIVQADGKGLILVLNQDDAKKYAELTHKFNGGLLFYKFSDKPQVANIGKISSPTDDGIIEFSDNRGTGNIAEYLRHRFGK